ncbi:MAG: metallophosphoesterase [Thermoguttaceae bacterium]
MKRSSFLALALILLAGAPALSSTIAGRVYLDANRNARLDPGEAGIAGVLVSDGRSVVATDAAGAYRLETPEPRSLLRITVPRDHAPATAFWRWADGAQPEHFGLVRRPQPADFCFVQITDTHVGRDDLVREFAEHVGKLPVPIAFVINTGDLVGGVDTVAVDKARPHYERYLGAAAAFKLPLFHLPGNHEHVAINVKEADKTDPLYGKGLYRQLLGPMHYSWDWGDVHFVALDGTSLPYQEKLGTEQLAWLRADLSLQPKDKPLVLFCHQSAPKLRDAKELAETLQGHKVLGLFCGHLHSTFTTELAGLPVYHTGALSGSWWSGPNPDGTPQGFRLIQIKGDKLKTAYNNREGSYPLYVSSPLASAVQSGKIDVELVVLDFGRPVELNARFAGHLVPVQLASREELWSTWKGTVDTTQAFDGDRLLRVASQLGNEMSWCEMRYLVVNGRQESYQTDVPATLKLQVRGINATDEILLDGQPLGTIPADTPNETTLSFELPSDRLAKVNRVTVRAGIERGTNKDDFSVGPVWLEYKKKKVYDLRYPTFHRHSVGDASPKRYKPEKDLYFCLP